LTLLGKRNYPLDMNSFAAVFALTMLGCSSEKEHPPGYWNSDDTDGEATADDTGSEDTGPDDTGPDDTGEPFSGVDDDRDGYPRWDTTTDILRADCDDNDDTVTPDVERLVLEGHFWRGDDDSPEASPASDIYVSSFCIDVHEITNADFTAFLQDRVDHGEDIYDEDLPLYDFDDTDDEVPPRIEDRMGTIAVVDGYDDHPVVEVFHFGADAYCAWLDKELPTEAEWEKAARGDTDRRTWPWGEAEPSCELGNLRLGMEGLDGEGGGVEPCINDTQPVGSYPAGASPYGALDMAGNVAEWAADWYQHDYYEECPQTDPEGPDEGYAEFPGMGELDARVSRGGGFATMILAAKVWGRYPELSDGSSNGVGFRCARPLR